jgi:7,8-dihydroneopterin aldolase/epimerase/oxygenase
MSTISIVDLEVHYHVGVPDEERANPQRLLLTVEMEYDFTTAARDDSIERTINYFSVSQELLRFGDNRSWKLIETLVTEIANRILAQYQPLSVKVEVKKFVIPQARFVSVSLTRQLK